MRIGWMFEGKQKNQLTGVGGFISGVEKEIRKMDNQNSYYALESNYMGFPIIENGIVEMNDPILKSKKMDMFCYMQDIELIHSFFNSFHLIEHKCKRVLTIHDLIPLVHPEWNPLSEYFDGPLRKSAEMADRIITDSYYTKKDVIEYYNIAEEKISVVYPGVKSSMSKEQCGDVVERYHLEDGYLLSVCTLEPRKNLRGLIEAFCAFKESHRGNKIKLVLTGKVGWDYTFKQYIESLGKLKSEIVLTGFVDEAVLAGLYRNALAVAYVSFYEGFGLPILEAMNIGKAVIASNMTSMPEVGGDAVIYCNPYEKDSIVNAIEQVVLNETIRTECEQRGIIRAKNFSYQKAANEVLNIYRSLDTSSYGG